MTNENPLTAGNGSVDEILIFGVSSKIIFIRSHLYFSLVVYLHFHDPVIQRPSLWVVSSLVPIVGGVALASFTETSFNW